MRNIYLVLARLHNPLGFIVPFTTWAKTLLQQLWDRQRDWDDPSLAGGVLQQRQNWEELPNLSQLSIPHCYMSS